MTKSENRVTTSASLNATNSILLLQTPTITSLLTTTLSANGTTQIWSQARTTSVSTTKTTTSTCTSTDSGGRETSALCSLIILPPGVVWLHLGKPIDPQSLVPNCGSSSASFSGLLLNFLKTIGDDVCGQKSDNPPEGGTNPPTPNDDDPPTPNDTDPSDSNDDGSPDATDEPRSQDLTSKNPSTTTPRMSTRSQDLTSKSPSTTTPRMSTRSQDLTSKNPSTTTPRMSTRSQDLTSKTPSNTTPRTNKTSATARSSGSISECGKTSVATTSSCSTVQGGRAECVTSKTTTIVPCSRTASKISSTSSTPSSSGSPTRYLLIPSLIVSKAAKQAFFASHLAGLPDITTSTLSDGTVDLWVVPLDDKKAASMQILMQNFGHFIPESVSVDEGDTQKANVTQSQTSKRSASRIKQGPRKARPLSKRNPPDIQSQYESDLRTWDTAIISQPQGYPVAQWDVHKDDYTYVRDITVDEGSGRRTYVIDEGFDMTHSEFSSRAPSRRTLGRDPANYRVSWIFADHDPNELFIDTSGVTWKPVTTWLDPNAPNPPRDPLSGLPLAYTDYSGHGTSVSSMIIGDTLGIVPFADYTMVKVVRYLNGPLKDQWPMYSIRSALRKILEDIETRITNGEDGFVINCSFSHKPDVFKAVPTFWPRDQVMNMYIELLDYFNSIGVSMVFSSGNDAELEPLTSRLITGLPPQIVKPPFFVVGSIRSDSYSSSFSKGFDGDGILTLSAPGQDVIVAVAEGPNAGGYELAEGTSFGKQSTAIALGHGEYESSLQNAATPKVAALVAFEMALPASVSESRRQGISLHQYVYNKLTQWAYPRVSRGPRVLSNGVPLAAFSQCDAQLNHKRDTDDSCIVAPISQSTGLSTSSSSRTSTASTFRTSISANRGTVESPVPSSQPVISEAHAIAGIAGAASTAATEIDACKVTTFSSTAYCNCGDVMAGLSTTVIAGTTSSWCATPGATIPSAAPSPVVSTHGPPPAASASPAHPSPTSSSVAPTFTPTVAFEAWREDSCDDTGCTSSIFGWDIVPDQTVDPCKDSKYTYEYDFPESVANDDSNYTIVLDSITSHGVKDIEFNGFSLGYGEDLVVGKLFLSKGGDLYGGGNVTCVAVPAAQATSCADSHSLDEDNWTPVFRGAW